MSAVWLLVGIVIVTILASPARKLVRSQAPFYAALNIIVVGFLFGVMFAIVVQVIIYFLIPSWVAAAALTAWGLVASGYLSYAPDDIDFHNKAQQVATVAAGCYLLITLAVLGLRIPF